MTKRKRFVPAARNTNKHTEIGLKRLDNSITRDGLISAITVANDDSTIAGSARLQTLADRMPDVETIVVETNGNQLVVVKRTDIPTADDPRAVRLGFADNWVAHVDFAPDGDVLAGLLAEDDKIFDGLITRDELADILPQAEPPEDAGPQMDRAEELREKWGVAVGDVWECGAHRICCGDCTDAAVVARVMGGERATVVFADPPYGVSVGAKNRLLNSVQKAGRNLTDIESDDASPDELKRRLVPAFVNVREVGMSPDCTVFVTAPQGGELGMMMMMMMIEAGLRVRHVLIWRKNQPTFSLGRLDYDYQHEPILMTWLKKHKRNKAGPFQTSVWDIDKPRASADHPTMKPVELIENCLLNHSDDSDIILDPFLGSGTTLVACERLHRRGRGIELSPAYVAVCLERLGALGLTPRRIEAAP